MNTVIIANALGDVPTQTYLLVEIKWLNVRLTQLYFQFVEENNYMFRPFSGWAIIRLRLEHREKFIYYNVDIKHGERDLVLQCLGRSAAI
jgi:hypothetical protein